jgi:Protein of unknown function (DUF2891)
MSEATVAFRRGPTLAAVSELVKIAEPWAKSITAAVQQEYPNAPRHVMRHEDDRPVPRAIHPAFYGCFDWHSAVEMHWALAALVREVPDGSFVSGARALLDRHLTASNLGREAEYLADNPSFERPYGWGWLLQLADELADWAENGDEQAAAWADNIRAPADRVEAGFLAWLPKQSYPDRSGVHSNSAFALARSMSYARRRARAGHPALADAIRDAAERWFADDERYPAGFEPGGADFLSPTLTEILLMKTLRTPHAFAAWCARFLPDGLPANLLHPVRVTDPADGQGAHLHGLNLYRVHALVRLDELAKDDARRAALDEALARHVEAGAAAMRETGWMAEHWLAAYAVLAFR